MHHVADSYESKMSATEGGIQGKLDAWNNACKQLLIAELSTLPDFAPPPKPCVRRQQRPLCLPLFSMNNRPFMAVQSVQWAKCGADCA